MIHLNSQKNAQAAIIELFLIVILAIGVFSYISTTNTPQKFVQEDILRNNHFETVLLSNESLLYIVDNIRADLSITASNYSSIRSFIRDHYPSNINILDESLTILSSSIYCNISSFNTQTVFLPIYTYNSSNSITEINYFEVRYCHEVS